MLRMISPLVAIDWISNSFNNRRSRLLGMLDAEAEVHVTWRGAAKSLGM